MGERGPLTEALYHERNPNWSQTSVEILLHFLNSVSVGKTEWEVSDRITPLCLSLHPKCYTPVWAAKHQTFINNSGGGRDAESIMQAFDPCRWPLLFKCHTSFSFLPPLHWRPVRFERGLLLWICERNNPKRTQPRTLSQKLSLSAESIRAKKEPKQTWKTSSNSAQVKDICFLLIAPK